MCKASQRKVVLIQSQVLGDPSFSQTIFLHFVPDEVIVRSISCNQATQYNVLEQTVGATTGLVFSVSKSNFVIHSSLTNGFLASSMNRETLTPQIHHVLNESVQGLQTFYIFDSNGDAFDFTGEILITLEFIKY